MKKIILSFFGVRSSISWVLLATGILLCSRQIALSKTIIMFWMVTYTNLLFQKSWSNNKSTDTMLMDSLLVPYHPKTTYTLYFILLSALTSVLTMLVMDLHVMYYNESLTASIYEYIILTPQDYAGAILWIVMITLGFSLLHLIKEGYLHFLMTLANFLFSIVFVIQFKSMTFLQDLGLHYVGLLICMGVFVFLKEDRTQKITKNSKKKTKEDDFIVQNNTKGILALSKMNIVTESSVLNNAWTFLNSMSAYYMFKIIYDIIDNGTVIASKTTNWMFFTIVLCMISALSASKSIRTLYEEKNMLRIVPVQPKQLFTALVYSALTPVLIAQLIVAVVILILFNFMPVSDFLMTAHPVEQIIHVLFMAILPISLFMICAIVHASKDRGIAKLTLVSALLVLFLFYVILRSLLKAVIPLKFILLIVVLFGPYPFISRLFSQAENIHS